MAERVTKTITADDESEVLDAITEVFTTLGYEDVIIMANKGSGDKICSAMRAKEAPIAVAMIGMLIKQLSQETDVASYDIAELLAKKLKYAEEKTAEELNKKTKKGKKIDIVLSTED